MLAIDQLKLMPKVEVATIIAVALGDFRIGGCFPFSALETQLGIRHLGIPAHMIEMQVRVDHVIDSFRLNLMGTQAGAQLLARPVMHLEEFGEFSDPIGTGLQLSMQSSVEDHPALRMLDQKTGNWNPYSPGLFGEN